MIEIKTTQELPKAAMWLEDQLARSKRNVVALYGEMGVGKTTLVGEFCRQRGITKGVSSPTFAIVNRYSGAGSDTIYHFDCYRFESEQEALDIGIYEYFDSGSLCFVEWPERIEKILSKCDTLAIKITALSPTSRRFEVL